MDKPVDLDQDEQDAGAASASPAAPPRTMTRRRLRWAAALTLVGAAIGALVGWVSQEPLYRAEGIIRIASSIPTPSDPEARLEMPRFQGFLSYQVALLESRRAAHLAMGTSTWKKTSGSSTPEAAQQFEERRRIVHVGQTPHIRVQFLDASADVAIAGVRALIEAYLKLSAALNDANERLEFARAQVEVLASKLKAGTDQILTFTAEYGGVEGLELRHVAAIKHVLATEERLRKLRQMIRNYPGAEESKAGSTRSIPPDLVAVDCPSMATALLALELLLAEEEYQQERLGEKNEAVVHLRRKIEVHEKRIRALARAWNQARYMKETGGATIEDLQGREEPLLALLVSMRARHRRIGQTRADVEKILASNEDLTRRLKQMAQLVERLEAQLLGSGRIAIADRGATPREHAVDQRPTYATAGASVGALPGLLALLLIGLRARRAKRSQPCKACGAVA